MKRLLLLIILSLSLIAIAYTGLCVYQSFCRPPIITAKIGLMVPLSGENFRYGLGVERGVLLAQKDLGLRNIEIISEDTRCDPELTKQAVEKLINQGVVAIIGEVCSGATLAAIPTINEHQVVLISPASTSPQLTDSSDYFFRTVPSDQLQGEFAAKLAYTRGFRRLGIIYSNEPYGQDFNTILTQNFTNLGGTVTRSESFEIGQIDLRTQLNRLKASSPDAVYIISNSLVSSAALVVQAKELGLEAQLFGSEALKDTGFLNNTGDASENLIITAVDEGHNEFKKKYEFAYQTEPIVFAAQGYDAFYALGLALKQGNLTGPQIAVFLENTSFNGVTGHIEFSNSDLVDSNYSIYEVHDSEFVLAGIESLL